jgi:hypothetical protein
MKPENIRTITYDLKPKWSRLLHRMHTLGSIQHNYYNDIASISAEGVYPMLIPSPKEDKSIAINGSQQWRFENWQNVTVRIVPEYKQAQFHFTSNEGEIFHEINLTGKSQWGCFECLMKIFIDSTEEIPASRTIPELPVRSALSKMNNNIIQVAKAVNREIIRGKKVICSIPLAGSSILKDLEFKSLMTQFGTAVFKKQDTRLRLNTDSVHHYQIVQNRNEFLTTLFNAKSKPLLLIRSV